MQPGAAAEEAEEAEADDKSEGVLATKVSFYHVVDELAGRLRSIFVPFFDSIFEDCKNELEALFEAANKAAGADTSGPKKKKKRKSREITDAGNAAEALRQLPERSQRWQLELLGLVASSLHKCFQYDIRGNATQVLLSNFIAFHLIHIHSAFHLSCALRSSCESLRYILHPQTQPSFIQTPCFALFEPVCLI